MLKNLKITAKLGIGFGIVLLLFAVSVFFSWQSISGVQSELAFLQIVSRSLEMVNEATDSVAWIRAGIRDLRYSESEEDIQALQNRILELLPALLKIFQNFEKNSRQSINFSLNIREWPRLQKPHLWKIHCAVLRLTLISSRNLYAENQQQLKN